MPRFSVVIPTFNTQRYLPACLESLSAQTFGDWEAVIVNDGSTDSCLDIARDHAVRDPRFRVVDLVQNQGRHRARKAGVAACQGDYLCFLDSDDTFEPDFFEKIQATLADEDVDCVFYGANVIAADGFPEEEARIVESHINVDEPVLHGRDIVARSFSDVPDARNWRLTQRVFRTSVAQRGFDLTVDKRLQLAEDIYEYFAIASLETSEATCIPARVNYYLGRGVSCARTLDVEGFEIYARSYQDTIEAFVALAPQVGFPEMVEPVLNRFRTDAGNAWHTRVADKDKMECAHDFARIMGRDVAAAQLARIARDVAYAQFVSEEQRRSVAGPRAWATLAQSFANAAQDEGKSKLLGAFEAFQKAALSHIADVEADRRPGSPVEEPKPEAPAPTPGLFDQVKSFVGSIFG